MMMASATIMIEEDAGLVGMKRRDIRRTATLHAAADRARRPLLLLLFQVVPIVIGANASFRDWALYNPKKTWVGLDHYRAVITDPAFLKVVLPNTFLFMSLSVAGSLVIGLALALLLNRPFAGQKLVQTILLVPLMVAPVIAAIMMRWMFNDQFGIVNVVLEGSGLEGQPWLVQRWSAFWHHPADRHLAVDALVHPAAAGRPAELAEGAVRSRRDRRHHAPGACSATSPCRCCAP